MFIFSLFILSMLGFYDFSFAESDSVMSGKGIYHRVRPAKKSQPVLDAYADMSDNDISEQIEVYSSADDSSYPYFSCSPKDCLSTSVSHIISRQQILDSGARDLLDILKVTLGLDVSREANGYFQVSYRGLRDDRRLKLIIDDYQVQDAYSGRNFWQIPADLIERVEIFYGPDAAEFGTDVINGVVRVLSRQQDGINAHVYGGGFSAYAGSVAVGGVSAIGHHYFAAQIETEEGPKLPVESDRFSHQGIHRDAESMMTKANRFLFSSVFQNDILISKKLDIHFLSSGQFFWQQRGPYIGAYDAVGPDSKLGLLAWNVNTQWHMPYAKSNTFDVRFYVHQNIVDHFFQLTPSPYVINDGVHVPHVFPNGIFYDLRYRLLTLGGEIKNVFYLSQDNILTVSGHLESSGILKDSFSIAMNRNLEGEPQAFGPLTRLHLLQNQPCNLYGFHSSLYGACRMTLDFMVLDEWKIEKTIRLFGGFRLFSFSDIAFDTSKNLAPKLGMVITPNSNWRLKLLFHQGIRMPTFKELYDEMPKTLSGIVPDQFLGNTQLKPEVARAVELQVAYQERYQQVHYSLETSGHFSRVLDVIEAIDKGDQNKLNNNGSYYIFGAEAEAKARFFGGSYIFFNIAWYRAFWQERDEQGNPTCQLGFWENEVGKNKCSLITHLPQLHFNAGLNLLLGKIGSLYLVAEFGSERRNNARSELERQRSFRIAPYTLLNVSFRSRPFFNYFIFHASVFNLFNFHTQDDVAWPDNLTGMVPREGTAFYLGLSMTI